MSAGVFPNTHSCRCEEGAASNFAHHLPVEMDSTQATFVEERIIPDNGLVGGRSFDFTIDPSPDSFLVLNNLVLDFKFMVTKDDNKVLDDTDAVVMTPLILSTMFQSIECRLNDQLINPESSQNIPYKSFIESILSYDAHGQGQLEARGSMKGGLVGMHTVERYRDANGKEKTRMVIAQHWRMGLIREGKEVQASGPLCVDFLRVNNHLAPGNKLSLRLTRAEDGIIFRVGRLSKNTNYKATITDMGLSLRWIQLLPSLTRTLLQNKAPEKYFGAHVVMKNFGVSPDLMQWIQPLVEQGNVLPKHIVVTMKSTQNYLGQRKDDTMSFKHFDVGHVALRRGNRSIPSKPLTPNFEEHRYAREYFRLFEQTGKAHGSFWHDLTPGYFRGSFPFFVWDMSPDLCNGGAHTHIGKLEEMQLELKFRKPIPEPITILVMMSFDQVISVDRSTREVHRQQF